MQYVVISDWTNQELPTIVECLKQNGFGVVRQFAHNVVGQWDTVEYIPRELMGHDDQTSLEAKLLKALGKERKKYDNKPSIGWGWDTYPEVRKAFGPDGVSL